MGSVKRSARNSFLAGIFSMPGRTLSAGSSGSRKKYIIGTLSNGGVRLLTDMAKFAGLPWDVIFSSDNFRCYKPAAEVYLGAAQLLDTAPQNVMLVAAHNYGLAAELVP